MFGCLQQFLSFEFDSKGPGSIPGGQPNPCPWCNGSIDIVHPVIQEHFKSAWDFSGYLTKYPELGDSSSNLGLRFEDSSLNASECPQQSNNPWGTGGSGTNPGGAGDSVIV